MRSPVANWLRSVAIILALTVVVSTTGGCRRSPAKQPFIDIVKRITGVRIESSDPSRPSQECVDEHAMEVLRAYLAEAIPIADTQRPSDGTARFSFRLDDTWETDVHVLAGDVFEWAGTRYQVRQDVATLFHGLADHRIAEWKIDAEDWALLKQYGWTPFYLIAIQDLELPASFVHRPGTYPTAVYWAFINELTKEINMDLTPYLGKRVIVRLYKLVERVPGSDLDRPYGRAIVARCDDKVIGAWLDIAHYACSLKGRGINMVAGPDFMDWKSVVIDPNEPLEQRLAASSPEVILQTYYEAINSKNYLLARACESRTSLMGELFAGRHSDLANLYEGSFNDEEGAGLGDFLSVKLLDIKRNAFYEEGAPAGTRCYTVTIDQEVRSQAGAGSGVIEPTATLRVETPQTGWRIEGVGFGR